MASVEEQIANGYQARRDDRLDLARGCFTQAVSLCRARGEMPDDLARALIGLAQIERDQGRLEESQRCYEEAVGLLRQSSEPQRLAHTIRHLADVLRHRGDTAYAETSYAEALAIYRAEETTPPLDLGNLLRGYALLKADMGRPQEALALWRETAALYEICGIEAGIMESKRQIALLSAKE